MDPNIQKSILQMARGAIQERADYEMSGILANILDPNTSATAKRKLTITLELKPDDTRQNIAVSVTAKSALAATSPVVTSLYVADEETVVEMVPQVPGQFSLGGGEQEAPPQLKLIKTSFVAVPAQRGAGVSKGKQDILAAFELLLGADLSLFEPQVNALLPRLFKAQEKKKERLERERILRENKEFLKEKGEM